MEYVIIVGMVIAIWAGFRSRLFEYGGVIIAQEISVGKADREVKFSKRTEKIKTKAASIDLIVNPDEFEDDWERMKKAKRKAMKAATEE